MQPIHVTLADAQADIDQLATDSSYAAAYYASLLRIALYPSLFDADDETRGAIFTALRRSEDNPTAQKLFNMLNSLAPFQIM